MAALSLATDLGMGQPMEQALRTCLIAIALGERLGLSSEDLSDVYYLALLRFLGCTADAYEFAAMVGGDDIGIRAAIAPVLGGAQSEFASRVMPRVGAGHGPLRLGGADRVRAALAARSGAAYDPAVASTFLAYAEELLNEDGVESPWEAVLAREPEPHPWVPEVRLDATLEAFADFADLKSPFTAGHSRGVAALAAATSPVEAETMRRAALLHDLGRLSVPNGIWDKPARLTDGEWERVRLHPYYSERILSRVTRLEPLAVLAGTHHERVDGSGYFRGSKRPEIPPAARILAAADAYQAMTQPRPHRPALSRDAAAGALLAEAHAGRLDANSVDAVLTAAGHLVRTAHESWPAGLSSREVQVLRLICRGGAKNQAAAPLVISPSTVDHHVRHIYDKIGVSTRAGATLFAIEKDLLE